MAERRLSAAFGLAQSFWDREAARTEVVLPCLFYKAVKLTSGSGRMPCWLRPCGGFLRAS
ncbi:hypothetical protein SMG44B_30224 [Stenotrophomonas maltophilia]